MEADIKTPARGGPEMGAGLPLPLFWRTMHPTPLPDRKWRESFPNRRVWCREYDACLDHAFRHGWAGFSCEDCPAFEPVTMDTEEREQDAERCRVLALAAQHPDAWQRMRP